MTRRWRKKALGIFCFDILCLTGRATRQQGVHHKENAKRRIFAHIAGLPTGYQQTPAPRTGASTYYSKAILPANVHNVKNISGKRTGFCSNKQISFPADQIPQAKAPGASLKKRLNFAI